MTPREVYACPVLTLEVFPVAGRGDARTEHVRLRMPDWVCVVPVTPDGRVVLVRQPRSGTGRDHLEAPGGVVDPGESPAEAARRELREETGLVASRWTDLGAVCPNPALQDNACFLYLAEDALQVGPPTPDPFEQLTRVERTWDEVAEALRTGAIDHALAVVALQRVLLERCGRMGP